MSDKIKRATRGFTATASSTASTMTHKIRSIFTLAIVALTSLTCFAQTQGNLPTAIEAVSDQLEGGANVGIGAITVPEPIAIGDTLLVGQYQTWFALPSPCTDGPYPTTDTLGNTWTTFPLSHTPTSPGQHIAFQLSCSVATHAGADVITGGLYSGGVCPSGMVYARVKGLSCDIDGTQQTTTQGGFIGGSTVLGTATTNHTTTVNGDGIISLSVTGNAVGTSDSSPGPLGQYLVQNGAHQNFLMEMENAGLAGSQSIGVDYWANVISMLSVALKPTVETIPTIITTGLADCAVGVVCNEYLQAVGGSGAYTFSVTSGTCSGMSMTSTTLGHYTGTPGAQGTCALIFGVTDGTNSSTQALNLTVGPSFRTPALVRSTNTNFNNGGGTITPFGTATPCGSSIVMIVNGDDSAGSTGFLQNIAGVNNKYTDNSGAPMQKIPLYGGVAPNPTYALVYGPFTSPVTWQVTAINNQDMSSSLPPAFIEEVSNIQGAVDLAAFGNKVTGSNSDTIAQTFTTLEPNELVFNTTATARGGDTLSYSGAFTLDQFFNAGGFVTGLIGTDLVGSPSTVTATTNTTSNCGQFCFFTSYNLGLRPRLPMSVCGEVSGAVRHKAEII